MARLNLNCLTVSASRENTEPCGIKGLMLAVLEDGLKAYFSKSLLVKNEAEDWIKQRNKRGPFSFQTICDVLNLDPGAVREALAKMQPNRKMPKRIHRTVRRYNLHSAH